ncbi:RsmD family RNA methyltransferase [Chitinophagaceae bacterium MMS25-I14]
MRIITGRFGGRRFNPPAGIPARPTMDIAKGGLFNMLENMTDIEGMKTLDIFGGTGSITYELASRGAEDLTIVEKDSTSISFIKQTVKDLGIADSCQVIRGDVFKFLKQCTEQYDFIFADPPYALPAMDEVPHLIFEKNLLQPEGIFVLEHTSKNNYTQHPNFFRTKNYGTSIFSFFKNVNPQ